MRFSLVLIILFGLSLNIVAQELDGNTEDVKWGSDLSDSGRDTVWQHLNAKFNEQEKLEGDNNYTSYSTSKLYVFISSSMPVPLLKAYAKEALKYDATLIFKGLPNGSFKELAELIAQLKDDKGNVANASIDDEAFELFSISSVPTVVLIEESTYHPSRTPHNNFDKITGNIGIKYALEQFESSGEIKEEAKKLLERAKYD